MKIIIKTAIFAAVLLLGVAMLLPAGDVLAQTSQQVQNGVNDIGGGGAQPLTTVIKTVVNVLLYFIGALSVIMIIYGGFKYVTSSGESSAVSSAKNTILYAVVGLIVALLAFTIVNYVIKVSSGNGVTNNPGTSQASGQEYDPKSTANSPSPSRPYGPTP